MMLKYFCKVSQNPHSNIPIQDGLQILFASECL
jgi:hypothetical protein